MLRHQYRIFGSILRRLFRGRWRKSSRELFARVNHAAGHVRNEICLLKQRNLGRDKFYIALFSSVGWLFNQQQISYGFILVVPCDEWLISYNRMYNRVSILTWVNYKFKTLKILNEILILFNCSNSEIHISASFARQVVRTENQVLTRCCVKLCLETCQFLIKFRLPLECTFCLAGFFPVGIKVLTWQKRMSF